MSSSLLSPNHFSALDVNAATDTLCSTLTSCLDNICPLSSRPARPAPTNSWLSDVLCELPSCTIKPLQMIQNAAAWLVFSEPKRAHVTPLFVSLHWLLVAACIKFKTLMLAYRTDTGSAPSYFHSLMTIYIPSRSLRSTSERRLVVPSQRGTKYLSRTFPFTVLGWWNELPTPIRNAESLTIFKRHLKTYLFSLHLTSSSSSKKKHLCSLSLTSPCLASFCSEQWLKRCITSTPVTVCFFIMYRLLYSTIVSRFG